MKMSKTLRAVIAVGSLALTLVITVLLSVRVGDIPPLAKLMSPFHGFWQNMESSRVPEQVSHHAHIRGSVDIIYDQRGVPHIYAENDADLYFAAGYVTARDRLWQMDFYTRASAGRLAEVLGSDALDYDRRQRRLGMPAGAERLLEDIRKDPEQYQILESYADGVNAWISQLRPKDYPLEFKLLDYQPEPYKPLNAALMIMNIAQTLTARTYAHSQSNARALLDDEIYQAMFPYRLPDAVPMVPETHDWNFEPVVVSPPGYFEPRVVAELPLESAPVGAGSNSWAVDGSKTATGNTILSSDPHLGVTYPAIWYEMHLVSDSVNVYGAALPSAPGIAIGFNQDLAWGVTSGSSLSMDIYEIEFQDDSFSEYLHDEQWLPVTIREEVIQVRGQAPHVEEVCYTHHGPIAQPDNEMVMSRAFPQGHAIRWIAHDGGNMLRATYNYNRASNVDEFHLAMRDYTTINMNYVVADRSGNISAGHYGKLPVRWPGQGTYINDGRNSEHDWQTDIPFEHLPYVKNPEQGFVFNANQIPVAENYPYPLGIYYAGYSRANRIHALLTDMNDISPADFEIMLQDSFLTRARDTLTVILPLLKDTELTELERKALEHLEHWDFNFDAQAVAPTIFARWQFALRDALWKPVFEHVEAHEIYMSKPSPDTIAAQIRAADNAFAVELYDAARASFSAVVDELAEQLGSDPDDWAYAQTRQFYVPHLANIPGLSSPPLSVGGASSTINAVGNFFAPSWRMVVEMTPEGPIASGHYAGGQSGNPGSVHYDNMTESWVSGYLQPMNYWRSADEAKAHAVSALTLKGEPQ